MKIYEAIAKAVKILEENEIEDASLKARYIMQDYLSKSKEELIRDKDTFDTNGNNFYDYFEKIEMVKNNIPYEYVIGKAYFFGEEYFVNENTLIPRLDTEILVDEALNKLGISHFADRIYMQMSGGEKQLVNLARILVQQPQLILFDEPTSALDYGNVFKTLSLIKELSLQGFTIIMTTHNPDHPMLLHSALPHSRVTILNEHGKLQTGLAPEIITEANLKALYQTDLRLVDVPALQRQICAITHL